MDHFAAPCCFFGGWRGCWELCIPVWPLGVPWGDNDPPVMRNSTKSHFFFFLLQSLMICCWGECLLLQFLPQCPAEGQLVVSSHHGFPSA